MTNSRFKNVADVAAWRLCLGCGACVPACPENNINLVDLADQGLRPQLDLSCCRSCGACLEVCPGLEISHPPCDGQVTEELQKAWGPVLEIWEGYACDPEIRFLGSSGGAATALALYCLNEEKMAGTLHIGADPQVPWKNAPLFSRTRAELLARTGSRYSPAAPCLRLDWIKKATAPCVFMGKPCDVVALRKSQAADPQLNDKIGLAISIFCAGTPPTEATEALLAALQVKPQQVKELRYRGAGWPGATSVKIDGDSEHERSMTYEQSWGDILSNYGQVRCRLCPDSTGEFADISCGDPWYRQVEPSDPGRSLVLVRTEKGRKILHRAIQTGYISLAPAPPWVLGQSQKALHNRRRHLWGRLLAMRAMRIPTPRYEGFFLFANWRELPVNSKIRSVLGTLKRIVRRKWNRAANLFADSTDKQTHTDAPTPTEPAVRS